MSFRVKFFTQDSSFRARMTDTDPVEGGAVRTVNGRAGDVVLGPDDVDIVNAENGNSIAGNDEFLYRDTGAEGNRKISWQNIRARLKSYFDGVYLTEHQSLADYATHAWVEAKHYLTEHQSLSAYATKVWVEAKGYLTEHQSLAAYALKSGEDDITVRKSSPKIAIINADSTRAVDLRTTSAGAGLYCTKPTGKWIAYEANDGSINLGAGAALSDVPDSADSSLKVASTGFVHGITDPLTGSVSTLTAAVDGLKVKTVDIAKNSSGSVSLAGEITTFLLIVNGYAEAVHFVHVGWMAASGGFNVAEVIRGSDLTVTCAAGAISVRNASTSRNVKATVVLFSGNFVE